MDDEKFLRNVDEALRNTLDMELQEPPSFGGKPGEPVPSRSSQRRREKF